jgi:predicted AlkP superfamily pyrophosphatase or phosphodiesterase
LLLLAALLCARAEAGPRDGYVAVISVDGLGASELFAAPSCLAANSAIRAIAAKGAVSRGVTGVLPTITYPSHATLSTGTNPVAHGVIDNGVRGIWFKDRSNIKRDTLWDAAQRAGRSVAIVTWPSTYGARVDYLVPEDLSNFSIPTTEIRAGSSPGLFDALSAGTGAPLLLPFTHPESGAALDAMTERFAAEVVRRHQPRLLLTHFLDYDHRMHADPHSAEACKSLERIDGYVARLLEAYRSAGILERTTVFIVSDHGFLRVRKLVSIFALLRGAGWSGLFPGEDVAKAFELKIGGGSVAFYPAADRPAQWLKRIRTELKPSIEREYGELVKWISPEKARAFGGFPGAAFTLCARPGYSFAVLPPENPGVLAEPGAVQGMHGYCPDQPEMNAVFIASGYGVRKVAPLAPMPMVDVAPTIASFLSVRLPQATGADISARFRSRP